MVKTQEGVGPIHNISILLTGSIYDSEYYCKTYRRKLK
jgi:hypothetical protein